MKPLNKQLMKLAEDYTQLTDKEIDGINKRIKVIQAARKAQSDALKEKGR